MLMLERGGLVLPRFFKDLKESELILLGTGVII
jgi:hypothetical protein